MKALNLTMNSSTENIPIQNSQDIRSPDSLSWLAIFAFSVFTIVFTFIGPGKIFNQLFPLGATLVAIFLYSRSPVLYNGFSWWMWFLVALVRRLVDLRSGFTEPSPILLAPYLVNLVSIMSILQSMRLNIRKGDWPFIISFFGVIYGIIIGIFNKPYLAVFIGGLNWLVPVCFGFYIYKNWKLYPAYKKNTQQVFMFGILLMGIYGIFQYFKLPTWDLLWIKETGLESSAGGVDDATGGGTRIWSTMPSTEPFAAIMAGGLLLLANQERPVSTAASVVGYISLLLTLVRSAWLGWLAGLLNLLVAFNLKQKTRLISIIICLSLVVVPITLTGQFSEKITGRVSSLSNVENDGSAQIRKETFNNSINSALSNPIGDGIEKGSMDNALLSTLFYLGWVGAVPYTLGLLLACFSLFNIKNKNDDSFIIVCQSIVISALIRLPVNGANTGVGGVMLWTFIALGIAADKYNHYYPKRID
jgi:hypothetical protein